MNSSIRKSEARTVGARDSKRACHSPHCQSVTDRERRPRRERRSRAMLARENLSVRGLLHTSWPRTKVSLFAIDELGLDVVRQKVRIERLAVRLNRSVLRPLLRGQPRATARAQLA